MILSTKKYYAKIATIPVLAVVLYAVFPRTEKRTTNDKSNPSETVDNPSRIRVPNSTAVLAKEKRPEWPVYGSADIANIDPFDKSMIFPESPISDRKADSLDASQQKLVSTSSSTQTTKVSDVKIQAIFQSSRGVAALVDTRLIHIGDRLNDGMEVTAITPEHLIVVAPTME